MHKDDFKNELEFRKANLQVLTRLRLIVEGKLSGEEQQAALTKIDKSITGMRLSIEQYTNPQWVRDQVAYEQKRKDETEERKKSGNLNSGWGSVEVL